ncbi:conserved exported hypothetical protein [Burkholderia sp. 8Y]|nr:conserved exported hypothetical protein [Burkholderia sp. 8Y]
MKRFITAISLTLLATLGGTLAAPTPSNAEWVQNGIGVPRAPGCDPGYSWQRMAVRYQCATPQPSCAYGFASGPAWNGSTWVYSCNAPPPPPPPPTCQTGYSQAAAPSWNGSAWVGQVCTPNGQQVPPPSPQSLCAARAKQDGITLGPLYMTRTNINEGMGKGTQYYYMPSPGPFWQQDPYSGNNWEIMCFFDNATGNWVLSQDQPYMRWIDSPYTDPGGG